MPKFKKWIYWIACALVLIGAAAVIILTLPRQDVIPTSKFDGSVRLSELSEDECIKFVKYYGISIPSSLKNDDLGTFVKENIVRFENAPYSIAVYDDNYFLKFAEDIRLAVNEYYGVPVLESGVYEFDECLYLNPLSSAVPPDGTESNKTYVVGDSFLRIPHMDTTGGSEEFYIGFWAAEPFSEEEWNAKLIAQLSGDNIDISQYTYQACYPVSERYSLYLMDGELWFVTETSDYIWSVYKLKQAS